PHLRSIAQERFEDSVVIDSASRRNLEIDCNLSGGRDNTLLDVLDHTATAMGSRLLGRWLNRPLRHMPTLQARQDSIAGLIEDYQYEAIQPVLKGIGDIERILARVALRSARPRDLARLRDALATLPELQASLEPITTPHIRHLAEQVATYPELAELLQRAIIENPPAVVRDGGVIKEGY